MEKWFELKVWLKPEIKEIISAKLFEVGAEGITEDLGFVSGYFPEKEKSNANLRWLSFISENPEYKKLKWEWLLVPEVNWVEKYKEYFKAQKLTHLFFLKPAWDNTTLIPPEMIPINMELGQAFGTGLHASTKLALHILEKGISKNWDPKKISVLDVGTGTGILAIAASKLGVDRVLGIDIDEVSIEVAQTNLQANQSPKIELSTKPIHEIKETFDIVVANILLETHLLLAEEYSRVCKPGGLLILSGFLSEQIKAFRKRSLKNWRWLEERHLQDWGAGLLGKVF